MRTTMNFDSNSSLVNVSGEMARRLPGSMTLKREPVRKIGARVLFPVDRVHQAGRPGESEVSGL
jgi:hypothetical protein